MRFVLIIAIVGLAASAPAAQPRTNDAARAQMRKELRQLSPVERQARIDEIKQKLGTGSVFRADAERRREQWKNLTPEQRRARAQEWRGQRPEGQLPNAMPAAARESQRKVLAQRLAVQIAELEKKKTEAPLQPQETRRLEQLRHVARYFELNSSSAKP